MIKLNAESLKDFQICARLYDYRHGTKDATEYVDIRQKRIERFDDIIKRVATFFFYKKEAFAEPSYNALLNRWQKLWFSDDTTAVDILNMKNEILWNGTVSFNTQAADALLKFHEDFANKDNFDIVLVDEKFCVPLNREIALEGIFDVVLREKLSNGQYHYHIYKWTSTAVKRTVAYWTFDLAILDYAFRYRNGNKPMNVSYYIWNFGGTSIGAKQLILEKQDRDLLKYWAESVNDTKVFIPRRGLTSYCKSCPFDKPCSRWKLQLNEDAN